jgi:hypothetical protein
MSDIQMRVKRRVIYLIAERLDSCRELICMELVIESVGKPDLCIPYALRSNARRDLLS